jgi:hypothetical protein
LWNGKKEGHVSQQQGQGQQQGGGQNTVRVTQPFAGQHQVSQADYLDRNQILPSNPQLTAMPQQQQPRTDFNGMYQNNPTPMPGAMNPGGMMEPMAANEMGGGGWSNW